MKEFLPKGEEQPARKRPARIVEKHYDFPVSLEIAQWVADVVEEIVNTFSLVDPGKPKLDKLPSWGTHWSEVDDEPFLLVKEHTFQDLATIIVRCTVNTDTKTFEFSYRWA